MSSNLSANDVRRIRSDMSSLLEDFLPEVDTLIEEAEQMETKINDLTQANDVLDAKVNDLEIENAYQEETISDLTAEVESLGDQVRVLEEQC